MGLIILPQALLKHSIPGIVNNFISLFKDTSLVFDRGHLRFSAQRGARSASIRSEQLGGPDDVDITGYAFRGHGLTGSSAGCHVPLFHVASNGALQHGLQGDSYE